MAHGASNTEITVLTGHSYRVEAEITEVERLILDAARGSILQLAWFVEAETGESIALNPEHIVALRARDS